jgi:diguanylate cyclase (GGDEF)-like protein/PAS domain S-box-containing protein
MTALRPPRPVPARVLGVVARALRRWGLLVVVPIVVAGAVTRADSLRGRADGEQRERIAFLRLSDAAASEARLVDVLFTSRHPSASLITAVSRADRRVATRIAELQRLSSGSESTDRFQRGDLPRQHAALHVSLARAMAVLELAAVNRGGSLDTQVVHRVAELERHITRAAARQNVSALSKRASAARGDLVFYGGAGLISLCIVGLLGLARRVSERRASGHELDLQRQHYQDIVETANDGVWTLDQDGITDFVNRKMAAMLGYEPAEMVGRPVFDFVGSADRSAARRNLAQLADGESVRLEFALRGRDGREIWTLLSTSPMRDHHGRVSGALAMVSDISDRRMLEGRLRQLAERDPLTEIANRRCLIEALDRVLHHGPDARPGGALLTLDLDNFKFANDTQGHAAGDAMLKAVAGILTGRARGTDLVSRLGGDEFAVVLPESAEEGALSFASDIRSLLCERPIGPPIMASIGIATFTEDDKITADEILVCADIALYEAKERGGDQVAVYRGQASGALTWVERIRCALDEDRFVLYGQPIIDLRTGAVDREELLVRMLSDEGEIIPPGAFIPTAERFGLIRRLDRWVVGEALGIALGGRRVAINLSGSTIGDLSIVAAVEKAVAAGLRPGAVVFEVTETAAMIDLDAAQLFATRLKALGCDVAIDDFGTGFGSFHALKHLPARYLKIDAEFVHDIVTDHVDLQIVKSMIDAGHFLGKLAVAEGIEDAEMLDVVRELGADHAQGFHLGRPERCSPARAVERVAGTLV